MMESKQQDRYGSMLYAGIITDILTITSTTNQFVTLSLHRITASLFGRQSKCQTGIEEMI